MKLRLFAIIGLFLFAGLQAQAAVSIPWNDVSKTGSSLAHLQTRNFSDLQNTSSGFLTFFDALTIDANPVAGTDYVLFRSAVGGLRRVLIQDLPGSGGGGSGTVTSVSVTTANGVSGSVATATTTPAISLTLGAITPTSVNSVVLSGASTPTLAVTGTSTISGTHAGTSSGTNTGDQTLPVGANPTGTIGLSAVNGVATSFLRSDAAPALSQAIVPTWTGLHLFNANLNIGNAATSAGVLKLFEDTDDGANFATFQVPALTANTVYILPPDDGDADEVLITDGSGTLVWGAVQAAFANETTTDPTINDDTTLGYVVGDEWKNTTTGHIWLATDVTDGAAVWKDEVNPLAGDVVYNDATSALGATNGQTAIEALKALIDALSFPGLADDNEVTNGEAMDSADPRANVGGTLGTTYVFTATTDFTLETGTGDLGKALVICDPSGGDTLHVVTMPDPTSVGRITRVLMHGGGAGTLRVDLDTDVDLDELGESIVAVSNGTIWIVTPRLNQITRYETLEYAISDETTSITTGTAKITFRMPFAGTLTGVRASLATTSSSGTPTFDINEGGTSVLSTKLTIDASEKTSTTAVTPAVISDSVLADDAEMTIDIDVAGTGAKGAKIKLFVTRAL